MCGPACPLRCIPASGGPVVAMHSLGQGLLAVEYAWTPTAESRGMDTGGVNGHRSVPQACQPEIRLLPTRRPASRSSPGVSRGWLGLLVPLLVWPHFSSNTSITAGVAAIAPLLSERGRPDHARAWRAYAARLSGASLTLVHMWLMGAWFIERTACTPSFSGYDEWLVWTSWNERDVWKGKSVRLGGKSVYFLG
jgi:hypothetical protein